MRKGLVSTGTLVFVFSSLKPRGVEAHLSKSDCERVGKLVGCNGGFGWCEATTKCKRPTSDSSRSYCQEVTYTETTIDSATCVEKDVPDNSSGSSSNPQYKTCQDADWSNPNIEPKEHLTDRDNDGIPDVFEDMGGADYDCDGIIDVKLPGAVVGKRDLYLEIDCMIELVDTPGKTPDNVANDPGEHSHCPNSPVIRDLVREFANSPIFNIDGTQGIQLHVDVGDIYGKNLVEKVTGSGGVTGEFGDFGQGGRIPEGSWSLVRYPPTDDAAGRMVPNNALVLRDLNFDTRRHPYWRWGFFGHQYATYDPSSGNYTPSNSTGRAAFGFLTVTFQPSPGSLGPDLQELRL